jgi:uncharacterized protein YfbU (UPF0304 family)
MELNAKERLAFIYQLRILEKLYSDDENHYAKKRTALECGFTLDYITDELDLDDELSVNDCKEVLDILDMYTAITLSIKNLKENKEELENHHYAKFQGFDGNHEPKLFSYTKYRIKDLDQYKELQKIKTDFNSHSRMLEQYRKMLREWQKIDVVLRYNMSKNDLNSVLNC